jgi:hypothetical protein
MSYIYYFKVTIKLFIIHAESFRILKKLNKKYRMPQFKLTECKAENRLHENVAEIRRERFILIVFNEFVKILKNTLRRNKANISTPS